MASDSVPGAIHRMGLTQVYRDVGTNTSGMGVGSDGPSRCNVIFVHGLGGHPESTWGGDVNRPPPPESSRRRSSTAVLDRKRKRASSTENNVGNEPDTAQSSRASFWPRGLLPKDIPHATIWTYGYNVDVVEGMFSASHQNSITRHGNDLAVNIKRHVCNGPLVFVAHGLGGVVVKVAISREEILQERTRAIIFLGTPHRASPTADWPKMASNLARAAFQSPVARVDVEIEVLRNISEEFGNIAVQKNLHMYSFQEARGMSGVKGFRGKVVNNISSTIGLPSEEVQTIDADHRQMVKCTGKGDPRYSAISAIIQRFARQADDNTTTHQETSTSNPPYEQTSSCTHPLGSSRSRPVPTTTHLMRPATRSDFEIAIICALPIEADAVEALLDHHWDDDGSYYSKADGDPNSYSTGSLSRHNIVLAHMPGMGSNSAAAVASSLRMSFPKVKLALVVGICGLAPTNRDSEVDMFLGDVVVSDGVIQYDFGRQLPDQFKRKDTLLDSLGRPNSEIRALLAKLRGRRGRQILEQKMAGHLRHLQRERDNGADYPGAVHDQLFKATYHHREQGALCHECQCSNDEICRRRSEQQPSPQPVVHFGLIASGNAVVKSAGDRDRITKQENIIAFEMEGAGVWDTFPCVVIKGGCDYADSHKTKKWQKYAAATAAACAKGFLEYWTSSNTGAHNCTAKFASGRHFSVPFPPNYDFIGREDILEDLRTRLFGENSRQRVALTGLGGVGKTQVAIHTAYWVKNNVDMPEWSVFWLPAISTAAFEQACSALARDLRITRPDEEDPDEEDPDEEDPKESLRNHLDSSRSGQWLLILDNADDKEIISGSTTLGGILGYLPKASHGRILITTRSRDVAFTTAENSMKELKEMSEREAEAFFLRRLSSDTPKPDATVLATLLKELTYLPLAISQAAAFITVHATPVSEYLSLLQDTEKEAIYLLSVEFPDQSRYENSEHAVATTWLVSFKQIRKNNPLAAKILSFISQIEPRAVPTSMLPPGKTKGDIASAVGTLSGYAFLQCRAAENGKMLDMHRLVHLAARLWVSQEQPMTAARQEALKHLKDIFKSDAWEERDTWRQYLPHVLKIIQTGGESQNWGVEECELAYWAGSCMRKDNRVAHAIKLLEDVVQVWEARVSEDNASRLSCQHALALAYRDNGQVKDALSLLEHVVRVQKLTLPEDHPDRLASQHNLAGAYRNNGRVKEAIDLLEHVVRVRKALPEDDPDRLSSQNSLAAAYRDNGRFKEAIDLFEHVVRVRQALRKDHPDRLASQHNLALVYYEANGDRQKALRLLEYVVDIKSQAFSPTHPSRLSSESKLAKMKEDFIAQAR